MMMVGGCSSWWLVMVGMVGVVGGGSRFGMWRNNTWECDVGSFGCKELQN